MVTSARPVHSSSSAALLEVPKAGENAKQWSQGLIQWFPVAQQPVLTAGMF